MVSIYRAIKRGYAVIAIGTHLSQAAFNFHCFNTTWPPEDHIEGPEVPHLVSICFCLSTQPHDLLSYRCLSMHMRLQCRSYGVKY